MSDSPLQFVPVSMSHLVIKLESWFFDTHKYKTPSWHPYFLSISLFLSIEKNTSFTLTRYKTKIKYNQYISREQPSPYELTYEVELDPNPHFKIILEPILDPLNEPPTMFSTHQTQKCWAWGGALRKIQVPHSKTIKSYHYHTYTTFSRKVSTTIGCQKHFFL